MSNFSNFIHTSDAEQQEDGRWKVVLQNGDMFLTNCEGTDVMEAKQDAYKILKQLKQNHETISKSPDCAMPYYRTNLLLRMQGSRHCYNYRKLLEDALCGSD